MDRCCLSCGAAETDRARRAPTNARLGQHLGQHLQYVIFFFFLDSILVRLGVYDPMWHLYRTILTISFPCPDVSLPLNIRIQYVISTCHRRDDIVPSSLCLCVHFPCHSGRARAAGGSTVQYGRATSTIRARGVDIAYLLHATGTLPLAIAKCERCEPWLTQPRLISRLARELFTSTVGR